MSTKRIIKKVLSESKKKKEEEDHHKKLQELDRDILMDYIMSGGDPDEKFAEFSQAYSGQTIISHREISKEEYLKEFDRDNDYLRDWSEEQKFNFINKIDYDGE